MDIKCKTMPEQKEETGFGEEIQTLPGTTNQPSPPLLLLLSVVVVVVVVVGLLLLPDIVGLLEDAVDAKLVGFEVEVVEDWPRFECNWKKNAKSRSWNFMLLDNLRNYCS